MPKSGAAAVPKSGSRMAAMVRGFGMLRDCELKRSHRRDGEHRHREEGERHRLGTVRRGGCDLRV
jgi:hypothetical protein